MLLCSFMNRIPRLSLKREETFLSSIIDSYGSKQVGKHCSSTEKERGAIVIEASV